MAVPPKPSKINAIPARIIVTPNALDAGYNPNLTTNGSPVRRNALLRGWLEAVR
jgi:hypothetical protein